TLIVLQSSPFTEKYNLTLHDALPIWRINPEWGAQRLINLIGVWHDQLIEILSAMGMRDVRRLRGDTGRSMMDLELREQSFKGIRSEEHTSELNPGCHLFAVVLLKKKT